MVMSMFRLILNTPTKCKYGHMDRWNNLFSPSNTISFIRYFTPNMEWDQTTQTVQSYKGVFLH